ncbi:MAG: CBS domain-containing protein [Elusimicrobiota bacterium]|nr:CBS domain-containing protein [Elusimicrobiota bacterium]
MLVKDVMLKDVLTVELSTPLNKLVKLFEKFHGHPLIPVVDKQQHLLGVIRISNLLNIFRDEPTEKLRNIPFVEQEISRKENIFEVELTPETGKIVIAYDLMDKKFDTISEDDTLEKAFKVMNMHSLEKLPVVDRENKLKGIIGIFDIILALFREKGVI